MENVKDVFEGMKTAPEPAPTNGVEQVIMHTITVMNRYPNGAIYIDKQKSYSWIAGQKMKSSTKKRAPKKQQLLVEESTKSSIFD